MGDLTRNFSRSEINCHCGCGEDKISLDLMERIQLLRDVIGPLVVTSGVRCSKYNIIQGGVEDSEHVASNGRVGEGIDIKCTDSTLRWKLIRAGVLLFKRIGEGDGFIHFGTRPSKPQEVLWNYYD